jgi:hypothetical protein
VFGDLLKLSHNIYMANIINKSNHPVGIKRVNITIWALRDEIEAAVAKRLKESNEAGVEPDISDLQEFYGRGPNIQTIEDIDEDEDDNIPAPAAVTDDNIDSSGNPMDDDAQDMMAAMQEAMGDESEADAAEDAQPVEDADEGDGGTVDQAAIDAMMASMDNPDAATGDNTEESNKDSEEPATETDTKTLFKKKLVRIHPTKDKLSHGFCLLSDLNMEYIMLFSKETFLKGQTIALEFNIPKRFILTCEVLKSDHIDRTSKVISETKPRYRIQAFITYNQPGERTNLREFLKSIEPDIPPPAKKLKRPTEESEDDDEFEDLGF